LEWRKADFDGTFKLELWFVSVPSALSLFPVNDDNDDGDVDVDAADDDKEDVEEKTGRIFSFSFVLREFNGSSS